MSFFTPPMLTTRLWLDYPPYIIHAHSKKGERFSIEKKLKEYIII